MTEPSLTCLNQKQNLTAASAAAAADAHGGAENADVRAALESAGVGEPECSRIAADPTVAPEAVRAAVKVANSRRTSNRAGFVVSLLRGDRPPELVREIAAERAELKRAAAAQASAGRLKLARETVAAASADAIEAAIEAACDFIRAAHPTSRPGSDFRRWRSCTGTAEAFAAALPPHLAVALSDALCKPAGVPA